MGEGEEARPCAEEEGRGSPVHTTTHTLAREREREGAGALVCKETGGRAEGSARARLSAGSLSPRPVAVGGRTELDWERRCSRKSWAGRRKGGGMFAALIGAPCFMELEFTNEEDLVRVPVKKEGSTDTEVRESHSA